MLVEIVAVHQPAGEVGVLRVVLGRVDIADVKGGSTGDAQLAHLRPCGGAKPAEHQEKGEKPCHRVEERHGTKIRTRGGAKLVVRAER